VLLWSLAHGIDGLVHISQISEERVDKVKNVLKVGQEVTARVIKIDKAERRIGLSIKAAQYTPERLLAEQKYLDSLKPGEDLLALQQIFEQATSTQQTKTASTEKPAEKSQQQEASPEENAQTPTQQQ